MGFTVNDETDFNPYAVLGVTRDADDDVIRAAWKTQVRKNHPDIVGPEGEAATARINAAYNMIRTPELRARYDRDHLAQQQPSVTTDPQREHVSMCTPLHGISPVCTRKRHKTHVPHRKRGRSSWIEAA